MPKQKKVKKTASAAQEIRRLGVFIEDTNDNVKLIAEQYGDTKKTLNSHTEMIGDLKTDLTTVKEKLNSHTEILKSHSGQLKVHTEMFGDIKTELAIIKEDVEFIKNSVKRKVDMEEFAALERRVALLEKRR